VSARFLIPKTKLLSGIKFEMVLLCNERYIEVIGKAVSSTVISCEARIVSEGGPLSSGLNSGVEISPERRVRAWFDPRSVHVNNMSVASRYVGWRARDPVDERG
jgi:hypothetical protein